jgi:MYXO-CTERM domain-containing protein
MKFKKLVVSTVIALITAMLGLSGVNASVMLVYTGNNFTDFQPPYNGTDHVTATIILADPLGNATSLTDVTPISFSISDGVQTITNAEAVFVFGTFAFGTDAVGAIDEWNILVQPLQGIINPTINQIQSINEPSGPVFDQVCCFFEGTQLRANASNSNNPGSWLVSAVPAPAPSNVAGLGMLGLIFLWRRRGQILTACLVVHRTRTGTYALRDA